MPNTNYEKKKKNNDRFQYHNKNKHKDRKIYINSYYIKIIYRQIHIKILIKRINDIRSILTILNKLMIKKYYKFQYIHEFDIYNLSKYNNKLIKYLQIFRRLVRKREQSEPSQTDA